MENNKSSDCCLTPNERFSAISWWEQVTLHVLVSSDVQWSTKHSTENSRLSNTNPLKVLKLKDVACMRSNVFHLCSCIVFKINERMCYTNISTISCCWSKFGINLFPSFHISRHLLRMLADEFGDFFYSWSLIFNVDTWTCIISYYYYYYYFAPVTN